MVFQPLWLAVGWIQAERVIPLVRSSEAESATWTLLFAPLKLRALPYRPRVVRLAPVTVPVFPLPEESAVVGPLPSAKAQAPTRPGGGGGAVAVVASAMAE